MKSKTIPNSVFFIPHLRRQRRSTMKHGKNPTVKQKKLMTEWHLNYENWLVVKDTPDAMTIVHRATGRTRTIKKGERE